MTVESVISNPMMRQLGSQMMQVANKPATTALAELAPKAIQEAAPGLEAAAGSKMGIGKAVLATVAGLLLFFIMGPRALKFAAKGASYLVKALINPKAMTALVHRGMMLFGMLEAALPVARALGFRTPQVSPQLAALSRSMTASNPVASQAVASGMASMQNLASQAIPMAEQMLPKASEYASHVLRQAPPSIQQGAHRFIGKLKDILREAKHVVQAASSRPAVPTSAQAITPIATHPPLPLRPPLS